MSTTLRPIGVVGGTGPHGRGLALRLAAAGHEVTIGSRDPERAERIAAELRERAPSIAGAGNRAACEAGEVVLITVPHDGLEQTLEPLGDALAGKVVISCVNPLTFDRLGPRPLRVGDHPSAAEACAAALPDARVASAFHGVSAALLGDLDADVAGDVLVCADDDDVAAEVVALAGRVGRLRGVHAGPLRLSQPVEDFTVALLSINRRHGVHAGVRIEGLEV